MDLLQRRVSREDTVQYKLFLVNDSDTNELEKRLSDLLKEILAKFATLLAHYIWHHQPFNLKLYSVKGDVPAHLGGSTQFTDNVEDEWFIVYLLHEITGAFPELIARVEDNDGEFLLIEAANYLPKWLNPDTSENRVFIYRGDLHIIPCPTDSKAVGVPKDEVPCLAKALSLLSSNSEACRASVNICTTVKKRLERYPERIQADLHHAHCFIPARIALILAKRPDLVAPAVSAFYLRDPIDLQACRNFKTFPPDTCILTMVTFTHCLYAQLQQQQFTPDRRSGFILPPRSDPKYKAQELGMKLAHGFEILCSKTRMPSSEPDAPISCNPQWKSFIECLKRNGYFKGELEGSALYKDLLYTAEHFFKQSVYSEYSILTPGEEVFQLLQSLPPFTLEELKQKESQLPPEDSDSWLNISEEDLEHMLKERTKECSSVKSQNPNVSKKPLCSQVEDNAGYSLVAVSQGMKNFLNAMSSHEGAEVPRFHQPFSFDPHSMVSAMDKLLDGCAGEELDSDDLDDDDDDEDGGDDNDWEEDEMESSVSSEMNGSETLKSLQLYMDQMDEELKATNIGQSFNQEHKADSHNAFSHTLGEGSVNGDEDVAPPEEDIQPLDIDLNLVTNLLESLSSQVGLAGPASNLLQSLGIHLPPNSDPS